MQIATDFEGGRIELRGGATTSAIHAERPASSRGFFSDPPFLDGRSGEQQVVLAIPPDDKTSFRQWFAFDAIGAPLAPQRLLIENAGACTWGDAFGGLYKVFASYDTERWFRVETTFVGGRLSFSHTPTTGGRVRYAYYPPYASARLARVLVDVRASSLAAEGKAACKPLVTTARGAQLHHVEIGDPSPGAKHLWIIAQQHPGEPMAGWFVEGLVERLLSVDEAPPSLQRREARRDDAAASLRARARVHIVPRMNPDGCALGNHRTNEAGIDLNREWGNAETKSVEVRAVRDAMKATGAALFLDVHGDERLPFVFAQPSDRYAARAPRILVLEEAFGAVMKKHDASFQTEHHYPIVQREKPNRALASTWAQSELGAVALTLEMPFSDDKNAQRPEGWSPERSKALGAATVGALAELLDQL